MLECPQFDDVRAQYADLLQDARDSMRIWHFAKITRNLPLRCSASADSAAKCAACLFLCNLALS